MTKNAHTPLDVGSKWELRRLSHRAPEKLVSEIYRLRAVNAELVKALELLANTSEDWAAADEDMAHYRNIESAYDGALEMARAALAKARGEGA